MFRFLLTVVVLVPLAFLGSSATAQTTTPLAGNWGGRWSGGNQSGSVSFRVSPQGVVTGTVTNDSAGITGQVSANLDANGGFVGTVQYPNQPAAGIVGSLRRVAGSTNTLSGAFSQRIAGRPFIGSFTLTAHRPNALSGTWRGSWLAGTGQRGTVALTIAADGSASGTIRNRSLGLQGTVVIQVNRRGRFTGTVRYADGTLVNVSGTMRGVPNSTTQLTGGFTDGDPRFPSGTFSLNRR